MKTLLDIDLDFFVEPIFHEVDADMRIADESAAIPVLSEVRNFLEDRCKVNYGKRYPGQAFEQHDELFDYIVQNFSEPIHLIHVDAHADIGGGLTRCWPYVFYDYAHQDLPARKRPNRGQAFLNSGNFIIFLVACNLVEKITFVCPTSWSDDYHPLYMEGFDIDSGALQIKKYNREDVRNAPLMSPLSAISHFVEKPIPFTRIQCDLYNSIKEPDFITITRSPEYTPQKADGLFSAIEELLMR